MITGINHIGIAVRDLNESMDLYGKIFSVIQFHIETVETQKVEIASFKVGNVLIELTSPTDEQSPIAKFIEKRGEGIHHVAFGTDDINESLENLKENKIKLVNNEPVEGAHNMLIAFLHPKSTGGVLMELCQPKNKE